MGRAKGGSHGWRGGGCSDCQRGASRVRHYPEKMAHKPGR